MYQRFHHQEKNNQPSARMSVVPESHLFLQGMNGTGDSGLVLSTDAKPRLKWTADLHERFIEAVNQLGGAEKATPKSVLKVMGIQGLTLYHLKSHLQKYRLSKNLHGQAYGGSNKTGSEDIIHDSNEIHMSNQNLGTQINKNINLGEAIQMQIEVHKRLQEQLEVQRHLQLRIEAQGKYLQTVLEKAQETLGRQDMGAIRLEAAKVQLSDLVSKVSNQCLNSAFSGMKDKSEFCQPQIEITPFVDYSMASCLTSGEGLLMDQELYNNSRGLKPPNIRAATEPMDRDNGIRPQSTQLRWHEDLNGNTNTSIGLQDGNWNRSANYQEKKFRGEDADIKDFCGSTDKNNLMTQEKHKTSSELKMSFFPTKLDLNTDYGYDAASSCKQLDLNGFGWD